MHRRVFSLQCFLDRLFESVPFHFFFTRRGFEGIREDEKKEHSAYSREKISYSWTPPTESRHLTLGKASDWRQLL